MLKDSALVHWWTMLSENSELVETFEYLRQESRCEEESLFCGKCTNNMLQSIHVSALENMINNGVTQDIFCSLPSYRWSLYASPSPEGRSGSVCSSKHASDL